MEFFAHNYQIGTILNKKIYKIPEYQREYSWDKEELESFWEDINLFDGKELFFGTVVLVGSNFNDSIGPFDVIDGQQRLTTFLILINRIVDRFRKLKEDELADALSTRLIFKDDNANSHLALINDNAHSFFQKIVFHNIDVIDESVEVKKLKDAKDFFEEKLLNLTKEEVIKLRDIILFINIIVVVQNEEQRAFEIFETLNFRGMDLTVLDLVKNFIVRKYPKKQGIDDPRETWKFILKNIKDDKKNFFNRYWASRYKKVSDARLYQEFKITTKDFTEDEVLNLLLDLKSVSGVYADVVTPSSSSWTDYCPHDRKDALSLKSAVESISKFQVKVHQAFLIVLLELSRSKTLHQKEIIDIIGIIEDFHFIFNAICSKRPSGMDQRYSKYAQDIRMNPADFKVVFSKLKKELAAKLPTESEFVENFSQLKFEAKKGLILYAFRVLEKSYQPGMQVDISEESLDHLSAQSNKEKWTHDVGNLILLEKGLNNLKDEEGLADAQAILGKSSYISTQDFLNSNFIPWDAKKVEARGRVLGQQVYSIVSKSLK